MYTELHELIVRMSKKQKNKTLDISPFRQKQIK